MATETGNRKAVAMQGNSRPITTNQTDPHPDIEALVEKHLSTPFRKPVAGFNADAFNNAMHAVDEHGRPWILDAGCGTAESTGNLARMYPDHTVVGIDRSLARLDRHREAWPDNALLFRADLVDFWRLLADSLHRPAYHCVLYPNPYPRKQQIRQRWHAHPVFPDMVRCCPRLELRSNWRIYLEEMQRALEFMGAVTHIAPLAEDTPAMTAFERKYRQSGQALYRLIASFQDTRR